MLPSSSGNNEPAPPNPVLTAYEGYVARTPAVTRYILNLQAISYLSSWFIDPVFALSNIPQFTLYKMELYRILLSPAVNGSFLSLVFAFLSFSDHGQRLESSMGSTAYGWLCLMLGILVNALFVLLSVLSSAIHQDQAAMFGSASGIWLILYALIAMECVQAPRHSHRRLFFFTNIPVLYYPVALFGLLSLLGGMFATCYMISLAVGYAVGYGYFHPMVHLQYGKAQEWENSILSNFTRHEGWITSQAATGVEAWSSSSSSSNTTTTAGGTTGMMSLSSMFRSPTTGAAGTTNSGEETTAAFTTTTTTGSSLSSSAGRTLGGATRRGHTDARAARLQALEVGGGASGDGGGGGGNGGNATADGAGGGSAVKKSTTPSSSSNKKDTTASMTKTAEIV